MTWQIEFLEEAKNDLKNLDHSSQIQILKGIRVVYKLAALQSSGVFNPRGSRQMCMQACPLGSLFAGIN